MPLKILLVYPDEQAITGAGNIGGICEPLALEYLSAGVKPDGHEVKILDLRLYKDDLAREAQSFQPDVVGVTGYTMHVLRNLEICREVKQIVPNCKTVAGGHHATLMPEDFFVPQMDYVIVHEGVFPFKDLCNALDRGGTTNSIPGVWANVNREFKLGAPAIEFDINTLPYPDREAVWADHEKYLGYPWVHYSEMEPIALARMTVGCPYRCSFCALWGIMDGLYHKRSVEGIVDELKTIRQNCISFVDDEPFIDGKRMDQLADAIKEAGIQKRYFAYCRVDTMLRIKDVIVKWRNIGLERLLVGIEFIQAAEQQDYNKKLKLAQIEDSLRFADEIGVKVFAQFITNPDWTKKDFDRLKRFIEHHRIDYPSFTVMTPIPGTSLLKNFDEILEKQSNGRPNWSLFDFQHPVTKTRMPTDEFMEEYLKLRNSFSCYADYNNPYEMSAQRLKNRDQAAMSPVFC